MPRATFADLADTVRERLRQIARDFDPAGSSRQSDLQTEQRTTWTGSASLADALALTERGYQSGTDKLRALTDEYAYAGAPAPSWESEVAGSRPCIPSYVAGAPDCMLQRVETVQDRPRVRLVAKCNFHCGIDAQAPLLYSAGLALAVDRLIADGHDVELVTIDSTDSHLWPIVVMPFGAPMDLSRLAFCVHPSFLRRVLFAIRESDDTLPSSVRSCGYGHPMDLDASRVSAAFPEHAESDVVSVLLPDVTYMEGRLLDAAKKGGDVAAVRLAIESFAPVIHAAIAASEV